MSGMNCARCKKLFNYISGPPLCKECREQDEKDFREIRDYLYLNPLSTMIQVSKDLNVSVRKISRFLKEGRLETKNFKNFSLRCRTCGTVIESGEYCKKCLSNLRNEISSSVGDQFKGNTKQETVQKTRDKDRMIVVNRHSKATYGKKNKR